MTALTNTGYGARRHGLVAVSLAHLAAHAVGDPHGAWLTERPLRGVYRHAMAAALIHLITQPDVLRALSTDDEATAADLLADLADGTHPLLRTPAGLRLSLSLTAEEWRTGCRSTGGFCVVLLEDHVSGNAVRDLALRLADAVERRVDGEGGGLLTSLLNDELASLTGL